MSPWHKWK